jgi:MarR family transcriptional regulator, temperature-dependent positive regulator of motility
MRLSRKSKKQAVAGDQRMARASGVASVLNGTEIKIAYKMGYVLNFYREPSFRKIETELGITRPEIVTLIFLNFREGVTASDICEFSGHLKANISRGIIALEKKKLLRREADRADNRRQLLYITLAGRALYARYIPGLREREQAMLACLTPSQRKTFERLLDILSAHVPNWAEFGDL